MSQATGIGEDALLLEIEDLLEKRQIKGRIDLIDKVSSLCRLPSHYKEADCIIDSTSQRVGP